MGATYGESVLNGSRLQSEPGGRRKRGEKRYYVEWRARRPRVAPSMGWLVSGLCARRASAATTSTASWPHSACRTCAPARETRVTVGEAGSRWLATRIDTAEATTVRHGVELKRIDRLPRLRAPSSSSTRPRSPPTSPRSPRRATPAPRSARRSQTLAMVIDHAGVEPNPARDRAVQAAARGAGGARPADRRPRRGGLPAARRRKHRLRAALARLVGRPRRQRSTRRSSPTTTSRRPARPAARRRRRRRREALWVELHPALADRLEAALGPREDRDPPARLFAGSGADALRTSIAKACRAAGIPLFSPHDLRTAASRCCTSGECPG